MIAEISRLSSIFAEKYRGRETGPLSQFGQPFHIFLPEMRLSMLFCESYYLFMIRETLPVSAQRISFNLSEGYFYRCTVVPIRSTAFLPAGIPRTLEGFGIK
jgi:hypothetical protein